MKKGNYLKIIAIFSLIFCSLLLFYYAYYHHFKKTIFEESSAYIVDISKGISEEINGQIEHFYDFLYIMYNFLAAEKVDTFQEVQTAIKKQEKYLRYQDLLFIDSESAGHRLNGQIIPLSNDKYIQETIKEKKQSISTLQTIDHKETVLLAIPVHNLILDDKNIIAIALIFEAREFEQILSLTSFNDRASSFLVNDKGELIIGPTSHDEMSIGYDTFQKFLQSQKDAVDTL